MISSSPFLDSFRVVGDPAYKGSSIILDVSCSQAEVFSK
jgi:hypothetical protein